MCLEKLIVHPDAQGHRLGERLIREAEASACGAERYELMTGKKSAKNIHIYSKCGYAIVRQEEKPDGTIMVWMSKPWPG